MTGAFKRPLPAARLCADCKHVHGGRAYGLCLVEDCPCLIAHVRPLAQRQRAADARRASRQAGKDFAQLSPAARETYERAVARLDATELTIEEFAAEAGLDLKLLWRTRRSLRGRAHTGGGVAP